MKKESQRWCHLLQESEAQKNGSKPIILGENKFADCGVMKRNHP